jgi:hypothetical protein
MQQALDALTTAHLVVEDDMLADEILQACKPLRERLAHCDRCGKKMGGEGDIHTCSPLELKRFEQWWDADDDIPNDGPYTPDTPIQFAWAGWQAALAQPEQEPVDADIASILACRDMLDAQPVPPRILMMPQAAAAQRQPLTDEWIHRTTVLMGFNPEWTTEIGIAHAIVRAAEAAHGITGEKP